MGVNPHYSLKKPEFTRWQEITVVPVTERGEMNLPKGEEGKYKVEFWFCRFTSNFSLEKIDLANEEPEPDSYIHIGPDTGDPKTTISKLRVATSVNAFFELIPNSKRRLKLVEIQIQAKNFRQSINEAYKLIMPFLSNWAFILDSAFSVNLIKSTLMKTGSFRVFALMDGKIKVWPTQLNQTIQNFNQYQLNLFSLYREAINNPFSPFYQVFLLYKIREGIYKQRGRISDKLSETIPKRSDKVHKDLLGKRFSEIHKRVESKFRNHFAHFNVTKSGLLRQSADRFDYFFDCVFKWLGVSFYITKVMVENEITCKS